MGETATMEKEVEKQGDIENLDAPKDNGGADEEGSLLDVKNPDAKDGEKKEPSEKQKDAESPKDEKPVGAPEKYSDPKLPEGVVLDPALKEKMEEKAKSLNLTQESYQELVDLHSEALKGFSEKTLNEYKKTIEGWKQETIKELGKDYQKELAFGSKAIDAVFKDQKQNAEFRTLLNDSGLGNHPLIVKFCNYFGKSVGEDKLVEGSPAGKDKTIAELMFPNLPPK